MPNDYVFKLDWYSRKLSNNPCYSQFPLKIPSIAIMVDYQNSRLPKPQTWPRWTTKKTFSLDSIAVSPKFVNLCKNLWSKFASEPSLSEFATPAMFISCSSSFPVPARLRLASTESARLGINRRSYPRFRGHGTCSSFPTTVWVSRIAQSGAYQPERSYLAALSRRHARTRAHATELTLHASSLVSVLFPSPSPFFLFPSPFYLRSALPVFLRFPRSRSSPGSQTAREISRRNRNRYGIGQPEIGLDDNGFPSLSSHGARVAVGVLYKRKWKNVHGTFIGHLC